MQLNLTPRIESIGRYTVEIRVSTHHTVTMGSGTDTREEPAVTAVINRGLRHVGSYDLNSTTMGTVHGLDATCEQILRAVLGDEDIMTGEPTRPEDLASLTGKSVDTSDDPTSEPTEIPKIEATEPDRFGWVRDADVIADHAGSGRFGDQAIGSAYDSRYRRQLDDGTWWIVTVAFFVENLRRDDEEEPDYGLRCAIEYIHCTDPDDPGGTETSSDYHYDDIAAEYGHNLHYYEREALRFALVDQRGRDMHYQVEEVLG